MPERSSRFAPARVATISPAGEAHAPRKATCPLAARRRRGGRFSRTPPMLRPRALIPSARRRLRPRGRRLQPHPGRDDHHSGGSDTEARRTEHRGCANPLGQPARQSPATAPNRPSRPATRSPNTGQAETSTSTTSVDTDTYRGTRPPRPARHHRPRPRQRHDLRHPVAAPLREHQSSPSRAYVITSPVHIDGDGKGTIFVQDPKGGELSGIPVPLLRGGALNFGCQAGRGRRHHRRGTPEFFGERPATGHQRRRDRRGRPGRAARAGRGLPPPTVATSGAKAEAYEGVLVQVENVTVTNPAVDVSDSRSARRAA